MRLPIKLPFLEKEVKIEYYLALLLSDEKITSVIFTQQQNKISIVTSSELKHEGNLENISQEKLLEKVDIVISKAEEAVPENISLENTIFGLKDTWIEEKGIRKEYLHKLKFLCDQLKLKPLGFIVLSEAIAHLIQEEEGAPLTALLVEVGKSILTVSLFKAGKFKKSKSKLISESPTHTLDDALKEFNEVEIFPSRIILFNSTSDHENTKIEQSFISYQWSKTLPFLHVPQIAVLPKGFDNKAIVAAAATQLGFPMTGLPVDVAHSDIKIMNEHIPHQTKNEDDIEPAKKDIHNENKEMKERLSKITQHESDKNTNDNFGFVIDKDITSIKPVIKSDDIQEDKHFSKKDQQEKQIEMTALEDDRETIENNIPDNYQQVKRSKKSRLSVFSSLNKIFIPIKHFSLPKLNIRKSIFIVPPVILFIIIGVFLLYYYNIKATVNLAVSPKKVNETQEIIFALNSNNDFAQNIIAAKDKIVILDGTATIATTGEKEVGTKAKGTVTIYNSDLAKKNIKGGTIITSDNNLSYTLDKDVAVASASGDIFTGIKSGTTQVNVTAKEIGNEYNLPSNTKFSFAESTVLAAKNEAAFSGGTKKKVTVVSKKDIDKLLEQLPKNLTDKAKTALREKLENGEELLPDLISTDFEKKIFNKDVGDETKNLTLTAKVKFTGASYLKIDTEQYAKTIIEQKYSKDQNISKDTIVKISGQKQKSDTEINSTAEIEGGLLPEINNGQIAKEITGKSFAQATEYIKSLPQVEEVKILFIPNIPFLPQMLPSFTKNININTEYK